jgi:NAD(P)-dependent dehydrogenase (short-subunit alcohol dehydrogenase family)
MKDTRSLFDLTGRVAVVTGASRGIGQATAIALAQAGADVASLHLQYPQNAAITSEAVRAAGRECLMVAGDVGQPGDVRAFARAVIAKFGRIDIWVNNASRLMVRPFLEMTDPAGHGSARPRPHSQCVLDHGHPADR